MFTKLTSKLHQGLSKLIPAFSVSAPAPEAVSIRILDKLGIACVEQFVAQVGVLREFRKDYFFHLLNVDLKPVWTNVMFILSGRVESITGIGRYRPDMLGDVWPVFQELERLKEMFARRIRLFAIDYWMRRKVRKPIMRLVSVVEQNLRSATHWRIG